MASRKPLLQWSILELVAVLSITTFVVGSMYSTNLISHLAQVVVLAIVFGNLTIAIIGKGEWRIFAMKSTVIVLGYGLLAYLLEGAPGQYPASSYDLKLPTTSLWFDLRDLLTQRELTQNGQPLTDGSGVYLADDGRTVLDQNGTEIGLAIAGGMGGGPGSPYMINETPDVRRFSQTGYFLWYLVGGYLGGKFAVAFRRYQKNCEAKQLVKQEPVLDE